MVRHQPESELSHWFRDGRQAQGADPQRSPSWAARKLCGLWRYWNGLVPTGAAMRQALRTPVRNDADVTRRRVTNPGLGLGFRFREGPSFLGLTSPVLKDQGRHHTAGYK